MTPAELAAEYRTAAEAWRARCTTRVPTSDAPLSVLLLMSFAETDAEDIFTGDMIGDLLAGIAETVERWLILVRHHVAEIVRAAQDAIRPPSRRKLTRSAASYTIALGARNVGRLLDAAKLAIPPGTPLPREDPDADPPSDRGP